MKTPLYVRLEEWALYLVLIDYIIWEWHLCVVFMYVSVRSRINFHKLYFFPCHRSDQGWPRLNICTTANNKLQLSLFTRYCVEKFKCLIVTLIDFEWNERLLEQDSLVRLEVECISPNHPSDTLRVQLLVSFFLRVILWMPRSRFPCLRKDTTSVGFESVVFVQMIPEGSTNKIHWSIQNSIFFTKKQRREQ